MRSTVLAAALAIAALTGSAEARPHRRTAPMCSDAARTSVLLPAGLDGIDGFRIVVAGARPGAATDVTVLANGRDRTLRAFTPGTSALLMSEPLRARRIEIALEPVLGAPAAACVSRVELLRAGAVVGTAEIR
jgi:hypothetical protein